MTRSSTVKILQRLGIKSTAQKLLETQYGDLGKVYDVKREDPNCISNEEELRNIIKDLRPLINLDGSEDKIIKYLDRRRQIWINKDTDMVSWFSVVHKRVTSFNFDEAVKKEADNDE